MVLSLYCSSTWKHLHYHLWHWNWMAQKTRLACNETSFSLFPPSISNTDLENDLKAEQSVVMHRWSSGTQALRFGEIWKRTRDRRHPLPLKDISETRKGKGEETKGKFQWRDETLEITGLEVVSIQTPWGFEAGWGRWMLGKRDRSVVINDLF